MNHESWLEANNHYLSVSLEWLRLRLRCLAPAEGNDEGLDDQINRAAAARAEAAQIEPPPALILLAQKFGLSDFERDTLLLCAAPEFDPGLAAHYGRAHGNSILNFPTFGLALIALDAPSWEALSPYRPLRYARLLEIDQARTSPLTSSALRVDERVVNFLKGLNVLDDRLRSILYSLGTRGESSAISASQRAIAESILQKLRRTDGNWSVVQLLGSDRGSKLSVASRVCAALGRELFCLAFEALPSQTADLESLARLWQREFILLPIALYVEGEDADRTAAESATLPRFLSQDLGLIFIGLRETALELKRASVALDIPRPTAAEQREAWIAALSGEKEAEAGAQMLAGQFDLNLGDIQETATAAPNDQKDEPRADKLWRACRELTRPRLDLLAQRIDPKATWDDLILPNEQRDLLRRIAGQVRDRHRVYSDWGFDRKMNRGFGISALFAGESGTGKTMGAEVIANDLCLNLYRIDLSAVMSKYIGETEKNLRKLFDAAEQGGAILFFDEADALFGKRSEVKDSHDRYANIEINYLLQRMESFSGLAILATNMKSALDRAFLRRLRFLVNFQFPGLNERRVIWRQALPQQTPTMDLDYERLARLNITGGNIHSIALNAAFIAAQDGQMVTMPIVLQAARMEFRKLEKPFNEMDFR